MNTKTMLLVIFVLVLVIAGAAYLSSQVPQPSSMQPEVITSTSTEPIAPAPVSPTKSAPVSASRPLIAADGTVLVYYTNAGFYPKTITVVRGASVRFVNQSSNAMRITPALPDDPQYGSLRQGKTVGYNGVFDFNFSRAGTWGYFNENMSSHNGVVLVK